MKQKVIEGIKEIVGNEEIIDSEEFKKIKTKAINMHKDEVALADVFVFAYNKIKSNLDVFYDEDNNYKSFVQNLIGKFNESEVQRLAELISKYGGGESVGDFYTHQNIKLIVNKSKADFYSFVNFFFRIFGD